MIQLKNAISPEVSGLRLDQALTKLFSEYSRSQIQQWIRQGKVLLNGKVCTKAKEKVKVAQTVEIEAETSMKESWGAQAIPLNIVYEDESLLIINKPAGLVVHPGAGNYDQTLVNALLHYAPELAEVPRAGLIHRLDKDTSGLLIVARNPSSHHALVKALQAREITREYEAIVQGVLTSGGTIDAPIGRHRIHRTRMAVISQGKPAITHYRIIKRFSAHTHIRLRLETGRTHQIRVHLAHIHYPILGDPLYGKKPIFPPDPSDSLKAAITQFKRQALHASRLELVHPVIKETMSWQAPLPQDMLSLLNELRDEADALH
jgi:23S rRNA pseudouridine1911/1915/1917 synthase